MALADRGNCTKRIAVLDQRLDLADMSCSPSAHSSTIDSSFLKVVEDQQELVE